MAKVWKVQITEYVTDEHVLAGDPPVVGRMFVNPQPPLFSSRLDAAKFIRTNNERQYRTEVEPGRLDNSYCGADWFMICEGPFEVEATQEEIMSEQQINARLYHDYRFTLEF